MVTTFSTKLDQFFRPIPAIHQDIELTRERKLEASKDPFGQGDFGLKATPSSAPLGVIELGPEGQEKVLIEQGREHPLVAKDIGHVLSMIFIPTTSWDLSASLFAKGIIHDKKEDRMGFDPQGMEELMQGDFCNLLQGPDVLAQESSEAAEGAVQKRPTEGLNH